MHAGLPRRRLSLILAVGFVLAAAAGPSAHVPLQPPGSLMVVVDLMVGSIHVTGRAPGECNHSADASIFQTPGQMWSARHRDPAGDVNLTLWRVKSGDMFTLFVTTGGKTHRVNTLQVGAPADRRGSGTTHLDLRGKSGQFTIDAVADTGVKVTGVVACAYFTSPEENGD